MVTLKCPQCGKLCREGIVPFPRCGRCHEQLLKCRYCADYDAQMLDCVSISRPDDFHISDPDRYLACPFHKSTLDLARQALVRSRVWVTTLILAVVAALAVVLLARHYAPPPAPAVVLHARIAPTEVVSVREPAIISIQIWNPGPGRVEQVVVALDRSCERHLRLDRIMPKPSRQRRTDRTRRMWFPALAAGGVLDLQLHVTPVRAGTCRLAAEIMAPGSGRRERVKTSLDIAS
ncbi:MAG TPA: hypothetical protein VM221_09825 [Armatimonadota bacterium]|nr:hypothetical protein [Armatimonadota bacterium]